ncbi:MAG: hypothetical protein ACI8RZ_002242 [Myxococcota bacterium]|jgi:hypothetical protein
MTHYPRTFAAFLILSLPVFSACTDKSEDSESSTSTEPTTDWEADTDTDTDTDSDTDADSDTDTDADADADASCGIVYNLPTDVDWTVPTTWDSETQDAFEQYSWQTFLAVNSDGVGSDVPTSGDTTPQWTNWSSTADLLNNSIEKISSKPSDSPAPRYYPDACQDVASYTSYRVLQQVGKVDDSFLEANGTGLSNDPVVDRNGNFIRYEVILSPNNHHYINNLLADTDYFQSLTEDVNFPCGDPSYTGGDPAAYDGGSYQMGAITLKAAWMDLSDEPSDVVARYHTEDLLVFSPGQDLIGTDGEPTCELTTMGLVGMHVVRKTPQQPVWTWATWEHVDNAPTCDDPMGSGGINQSCPQPDSTDYAFYGSDCGQLNSDGTAKESSDICTDCNVGPTPADDCSALDNGWCLDGGQDATPHGVSRICSQVSSDEYPEAQAWNETCQAALKDSVWGNYQLLATQWVPIPKGFDPTAGCVTVQQDADWIASSSVVTPTISIKKPILGNNAMESYERSNCMGCHNAKTTNNTVKTDDGNIYPHQLLPAPLDPSAKDVTWGTHQPDFAWWLSQEVPEALSKQQYSKQQ